MIGRSRNALVGAILGVVAALIAVGCGSAGPGQASTDAAASQTAATDNTSPIADLIGVPITDDDAMQEYVAQAQREAESAIAECMRSQGFEYVPVDPDHSGTDIDISNEPPDRSFAEEFGF